MYKKKCEIKEKQQNKKINLYSHRGKECMHYALLLENTLSKEINNNNNNNDNKTFLLFCTTDSLDLGMQHEYRILSQPFKRTENT